MLIVRVESNPTCKYLLVDQKRYVRPVADLDLEKSRAGKGGFNYPSDFSSFCNFFFFRPGKIEGWVPPYIRQCRALNGRCLEIQHGCALRNGNLLRTYHSFNLRPLKYE